jgi:hypothetical protein
MSSHNTDSSVVGRRRRSWFLVGLEIFWMVILLFMTPLVQSTHGWTTKSNTLQLMMGIIAGSYQA